MRSAGWDAKAWVVFGQVVFVPTGRPVAPVSPRSGPWAGSKQPALALTCHPALSICYVALSVCYKAGPGADTGEEGKSRPLQGGRPGVCVLGLGAGGVLRDIA